MQLNKIIQKPIVTEKSIGQIETSNRHHFKVHLKASKHAIAKTIAEMFGVDVEEVRTMVMPGKRKRIRGSRKFTKTPKWKKAVVTVKEGQEIKYD